ncbi:ALK and LTK ligand 2-like isoform X2 [Denticeps clupeoides]|uniref:ALK and LTK ligand 2-like isoform X2 n=1 Tax=Denticeps clupeoides TaxID=299321 RepID=UPI0010A378CC|nr:ALK and LTK ligand 2-like isoform X2 [Denticeps clupeoides]
MCAPRALLVAGLALTLLSRALHAAGGEDRSSGGRGPEAARSPARSADPGDSRATEVFRRDVRKKEKFLKHLTGPLYFSPKCRKLLYRLYNNSRDCSMPSHYRRCARLLTRLAGSPRCTET